MTTPLDLAYRNTSLAPGARRHLERLMASWNLLADLCFSDLLIYVPFDALATGFGEGDQRLVVLGQVRPTTSQTLFEIDLVGEVVASEQLPLVVEALRTGAVAIGEQRNEAGEGHLRVECIPVRYSGQILGVMTRVWSPSIARRRGALERVYLDLFERLSLMVTDGIFPFADDELPAEHSPRVGDGVLVIDDRGRITFASPNAVSALHRVGIMSAINGSSLQSLGLDTTIVEDSFASQLPVVEEIERRSEVTLLLRSIPLLDRGEVTGALVLLRDLTDVRSRDRLLLTKDATIREVHHRVKNNLQTISSLLRLQARRIDAPEGKTALGEAERRIRAIAIVHEILSRDAGDQVPFDEIVHALVRMAKESSVGPVAVAVQVVGEIGDIPAEMATPLSVVLAELLQNAIEHAFPLPAAPERSAPVPADRETADAAGTEAAGTDAAGTEAAGTETAGVATAGAGDGAAREGAVDDAPVVELAFDHDPEHYGVIVRDNGVGLPDGFDIEKTRSLGLSIVRDLVRTQLNGTITMTSEHGTVVRLDVPARRAVSR